MTPHANVAEELQNDSIASLVNIFSTACNREHFLKSLHECNNAQRGTRISRGCKLGVCGRTWQSSDKLQLPYDLVDVFLGDCLIMGLTSMKQFHPQR